MAMNPHRVLRRPLLTEKTTIQRDKFMDRPHHNNYVKYAIDVDPAATKTDIRHALESLFPEVRGHIVKINTSRLRGKKRDPDKNRRYRRFRPGRTMARKKAIVTLRDGVTINQFEGI